MIEPGESLVRVPLKLNSGVDELVASTDSESSSYLALENWRISKDGKRLEKRNGLTVIDSSTFGAHDIFGYHTYYDGSANFCQIVICEDKIWRKVGAGAWATIRTLGSTLAHPSRFLEVQGKQIFISEIENRMISSAGTLGYYGITAPASAPTVTPTYDSTLLDEDMAAIGDWDDDDQGAGAISQATYDSRSTMRMLNTGAAGDVAAASRVVSGIGSAYTIEMVSYINTIGVNTDSNHFLLVFYNGRVKLSIRIDSNDLYVYSGKYWVSAGHNIITDQWTTWKFYVNSDEPGEEYVEIFNQGYSIGQFKCTEKSTTTPGELQIGLYGSTVATDMYIDSIKIGNALSGNILGMVRYALTYGRDGNYGHESNPIISQIGSVTFSGAGLNDMTVTGTYLGTVNKNIKVEVETAGATDTIRWSEDGGATWAAKGIKMAATVVLPLGITLVFAATTGHTATNSWSFTASAMAGDFCHQTAVLTNLPVSSDPQVNCRYLYRTMPLGATYYRVAKLDNVATSYTDNQTDDVVAKGEALLLDADVPPLGKFSCYWDERMWIADDDDNIIYYSAANRPEAFYTTAIGGRVINMRGGASWDRITGMIPFKSHLFVFKQDQIFIIRKRNDGLYGRYQIVSDYGCIAPWSLIEVGGLLMFLSHRGWEVFNGCASYSVQFSAPMTKTMATIDKTKLDLIVAAHHRERYEVWLSLPDRSGGAAATTVVCNYMGPVFYKFSFAKVPSLLCEARDTNGIKRTYFGSRDGILYTADLGTQDGTTNITASGRFSWIRFPVVFRARRLEAEIEAPTGITLSLSLYTNQQKTAVTTRTIAGSTPASTDQDYRLPIFDYEELAINGKYIALGFSESGNVGDALKINMIDMMFAGITRKKRIAGD